MKKATFQVVETNPIGGGEHRIILRPVDSEDLGLGSASLVIRRATPEAIKQFPLASQWNLAITSVKTSATESPVAAQASADPAP